MRVRAKTMTKIFMEITVLDVAPETDIELVRQAMGQYGEVKKCERMTVPADYSKVVVNKVKVELVPNKNKLLNAIHTFGTTASANDFLTWKLQYRGCAVCQVLLRVRGHHPRQCLERGLTREELQKVTSVVGEEQGLGKRNFTLA